MLAGRKDPSTRLAVSCTRIRQKKDRHLIVGMILEEERANRVRRSRGSTVKDTL
jgi:hypothetical protein